MKEILDKLCVCVCALVSHGCDFTLNLTLLAENDVYTFGPCEVNIKIIERKPIIQAQGLTELLQI